MRVKTYCKFLLVLGCLFFCFGFVSIVGASDVSDVPAAIAQVAKSDATIKLELSMPSSTSQSYLDWRDMDWKDPFLKHGQVKVYASHKAPTNSNVSATVDQVAKSDSTIEMDQVAQASSTSSPQSYLDWRDLDWKDPFVRNGKDLRILGSLKAPTHSDASAVIDQVAKSDSTMKLELRMPSPTSILTSDSFDDLEDPFSSELGSPDMPDPFEDYNRFMFDFNEGFYDNLMEPVVRGYRDTVNEGVRMGISNIFDNAMAPLKLVSSFLQGDFDKTGRVIGRTVINTTLGLGGMFDVADKAFGIEDVNEDLDQALGSWGVPTGPYVVLPLFGPSSVRNIFGRAGGIFLSPTYHFAPGVEVGGGLTVTDQINDTSFIVDDIEQLDNSTIDKYESVRDFYGQYRKGLVND